MCAEDEKQVQEQEVRGLFVFLRGHMASRAVDTASFVSKKSTSPAAMFTSRLVLPSAMIWTEKSACVANLPHLHKNTRARFLLLAVVMVLLLYCGWFFWCCYYIQLPIALSSLLITCNEKRKMKRTSKKAKKAKNFGKVLFPNDQFSRRQLRPEKG